MQNSERLLVANSRHIEHPGWTDSEHKPWDTPERIFKVVKALQEEGADNREWRIETVSTPETRRIVETVHDPAMVKALQEASRLALGESFNTTKYDLDVDEGSSPLYHHTFEQALTSVQCALSGAESLMSEETDLAVTVSRPPGHHAGRDFYHGFCYLNLAASASEKFRQEGYRTAIIDFDIHCGDGTADIVQHLDEVSYTSLHADPRVVMPHTGFASEHGSRGNLSFRPLELGISSKDYIHTYYQELKKIYDYNPDFLIVEAGFDGHAREYPNLPPLTALEDADYRHLGKLTGLLKIPTLVVLSGGYNQDVTAGAFTNYLGGIRQARDEKEIIFTRKEK